MTSPLHEDEPPEPPRLRLLRLMVTALTGFLILAVIAVVTLLVIRLTAAPRPVAIALPETVRLPPGEVAEAATIGRGWLLVVTRNRDGRETIRIFDAATGEARQSVAVEAAPP
jgi:hypothetical protein